jgi:hypothetical protein
MTEHEHKLNEEGEKQKCFGEQGKPLLLPAEDDEEELYKVYGFNALLIDRIALNRSLLDITHKV